MVARLHQLVRICIALFCTLFWIISDSQAQQQKNRVCMVLDMSFENCTRITGVAYTPPLQPWPITTKTSVAGGSSLRSADIDEDQSTCVVLELTLPAHSVITVAGRTSSEGNHDQLQIFADNLRLDTISAELGQTERDWRQQNYFLPTAISALRWCYVKDIITYVGTDTAWIDNLSFSTSSISYQSRICEALDITNSDCSSIRSVSYEPPHLLWLITTETSVAGGTSLRSADISNTLQSCLVLERSLPADSVISVAGRTSSHGGFNQLQIAADNLRLATISAPFEQIERDWKQENYFLPTAISTMRWCYAKGSFSRAGFNTAWIDNLSFSTSTISYQSRICEALDITNSDCSMIQSVSYEPPHLLWIITSATAVAGGTSLRSGDISNNQQSCLLLELSLPANSVISVAGRTSSESGADPLQIIADNRRIDTISAEPGQTERDWRQQSYFLPTAISTLSWCYEKSIFTSQGQDAVWIDNLSFSTSGISYLARICYALDLTASNCAAIRAVIHDPPDQPWLITTNTSVAGGSSLRSADIDKDQSTCVVLELALPAHSVITVAGRTSSEGNFDQLQIFADNLRLDTISAELGQSERDWRQQNYFLPEAISALRWCYVKDSITDLGTDTAWIDNLSFGTSSISYQSRICEALDITNSDCLSIRSVSYEPQHLLWLITTETSVAGGTSLRSADISNNQQSCLVLELSLPADSVISVAGRTSSQGGLNQLQIAADSLRLATISAPFEQIERDWRQENYFLPAAISMLRWCYAKSSFSRDGFNTAWIDNLSFSASGISYQSRICEALDITNSNCSQIQSVSYEPPHLLWIITTETSVAGGTSLRSADISNNQQSCLLLELSLSAGSVISVAGRTSSEGGADQLQIIAGNMDIDTISAAPGQLERDWRQQSYLLPTAISTLSWCYEKNSFFSQGQDAAWIDSLSFSIPAVLQNNLICSALDLTASNCAAIRAVVHEPPDQPWLITAKTSVAGGTSLRSADIDHDQQSCLLLRVMLPAGAVISVAGRISAEGQADQLQVLTDRQRLDIITAVAGSSDRSWQQRIYYLHRDITALRWCYVKDGANDAGDDRAWIDNLSFSTPNILYREHVCEALDLTTSDCSMIESVTYEPPQSQWLITTGTSFAGGSSMQSGFLDLLQIQASCLFLNLILPANSVVSVAARTSSEGQADQLQISAGGVQIDTISAEVGSSERDWALQTYYLPSSIRGLNFIRGLSFCYFADGDNRAGADTAWIDSLSFSTSSVPYQSRVCDALDLTSQDCAMIRSVSYNPARVQWVITSQTSVAGGTSLRSGDIRHNQTSCLMLEILLPDPLLIRFSLRTLSEAVNDFLYFEADEIRLVDRFTAEQGSAVRDWEQQEVFVAGDISQLKWCYTKNDRVDGGSDSGWLDTLSFVVPEMIEATADICSALDLSTDNCSQIRSVSFAPPDSPWLITTKTSVAGGSSMRSGEIDHNQQSCLLLELLLPAGAEISVAGRTSSEGRADQLRVFANNQRLDTIAAVAGSSDRDWQQRIYYLPRNITVLSWCYVKDRANDAGADSAWIDNLSFSTSNISYQSRICSALDLTASDCSMIQSVTYDPPHHLWLITTDTFFAGGTSLRSGYIDHNRQSCLLLGLPLPADSAISVAGRTSSEGQADQLQISAGGHLIDTISAEVGSSERDWAAQTWYLPARGPGLSFCYTRDSANRAGADAAWIDSLSFSTSSISYQSRICAALDLTSRDCAMIQSVSYNPARALWVITSQTSVAGGTSLRSGDIRHNQTSCLVLEISLPDSSLIRFSLRTLSEAVNDFLYFEADENRLVDRFTAARGSAVRDWEQQEVPVSGNISQLRWCYTKNDRVDGGSDSGWLDMLSFVVPEIISPTADICSALDLSADNCSMIESVSYDPPDQPWLITAETSVAGGTSLRSADIDHGQQSCLLLELSLPAGAVISVAARTSSEGPADQLRILADNLRLDTIAAVAGSSDRNWQQQTWYLPRDITVLSWCYVKNDTNDEGADSAWIDNLSFSTSSISYQSRICSALDLTARDCSLIQSVSYEPPQLLWIITTETSVAGDSSLRSGHTDGGLSTCVVLELTLPANSVISVAGRTSSAGRADQLRILADDLRLNTITVEAEQLERDWREESYLLPTAISTLSWCYEKDNFFSQGQDAAWIDNLSFSIPAVSYQSRICAALDLTASNCAAIRAVVHEPPDRPWLITAETSVAGGTSLRSADIDHDQQSCLKLGVVLPAGAVISVAGRISAEGQADQLQVLTDSQRLDIITAVAGSSDRSWQQRIYYLHRDITALRWCYVKDGANNAGDDRAWIDNLSFNTPNILYREHVCEALDLTASDCSMIESVTYEPPQSQWLITTGTSFAGGSSMHSGFLDLLQIQASCLFLNLILPANSVVSVAARTSSEGQADQLQISAGGVQIDTISAEVGSSERDWALQTYYLPSSIRELNIIRGLSFCYFADGDNRAGADTAWIDSLSFSTSSVPYQSRICEALDLTSQDCAMIQSVSYNPARVQWVITSQTSVAGGTSLRSGDIRHNQTSCLVLEISLPDPLLIRFSLRTLSEATHDFLYFEANENRLVDRFTAEQGSAFRDWEQQEVFVAGDTTSQLKWCYTKNDRFNEGSDSGWLDMLSFVVPEIISATADICSALDLSTDNCSQIRSVSFAPPDSPWLITTKTSVAGGSSLRSGEIDHNQQSCLLLELSLPAGAVISAAGRTSSEGPADQLRVFANNQRLDTIAAVAGSSDRDWQQRIYYLPRNITVLAWCYVKDGANDAGADSAWIDNLSFNTSNISYQSRICEALDLTASDCSMILSVTYDPPQHLWLITTDTFFAGGSSLRSGDIDHFQASCLLLALPLPEDSVISVAGRTSSEGQADQLQISAGGHLIDTISAEVGSSERDWAAQTWYLPARGPGLSFCYTRDSANRAGTDAAWIDSLSFSTSSVPYQSRICAVLDLTNQDCEMIQSVSYNPARVLWVITSQTSVAGGTSLRSGDIRHNQTSCLMLEISLPDPLLIRFSLRTLSEAVNDFLYFEADENRLVDRFTAEQGSAVRDWEQQEVFVAGDISQLQWCYTKNDRFDEGNDSGWLDMLSFVVPEMIEATADICSTLDLSADNCSQIRSVSFAPPDSPWLITTKTSVAGGSSLQSGEIDHNQQSCLLLELSLPAGAVISVAGRTRSAGPADQLRILANNQRLDTIAAVAGSSDRNWQQRTYYLPRNITVLSWCYVKDDANDEGTDSAWIDNLSFSTSNISYQERICDVLDLTAGDCSLIQSVSYEPPQLLWIITTETSVAGGSSLRSGDIDGGQSTCVVLELSLPADSRTSVAARTRSAGEFDQLQISADSLLIDTISAAPEQLERDWIQQSYLLPTASSALSWCYEKNHLSPLGQNAAWIDNLSFSIPATVHQNLICAALDLTASDCAMIRSVTYNPPQQQWQITTATSVAGGSSLRSADIGGDQSTCIMLELALPANSVVSVAARTRSEGRADQLRILADNQRLDTIAAVAGSSDRDWQQQIYYLPRNITVLSWCYAKDPANNEGDDSAWIDNLSFSTSNISYRSRICSALDLTASDCSLIQSVSYEPPQSLWIITSDTSVAGGSSLRSGHTDSGQSTCVVLELTLPANSVISVAGRARFNGAFDQLQISADNLRLDTISAATGETERDWRQQSYVLPATISRLRWCHARGNHPDRSSDAVWIDNLSFSTSNISYQNRICDVLDLTASDCAMIQSVSYDPPQSLWIITSDTSVAGGSSLRSANIDGGQSTCIVLGLTLPTNSVISVAGRSSSDGGFDQLQVSADNLRLDTISAATGETERDWMQQSYILPTTISTLRWCYAKDNHFDRGSDAVWVDNLSFSTSNISYQSRICAVLDLTASDCSLIQSVSYEPPQLLWVITSDTSVAGGSSLRSADIDGSQSTCVVLGLTLPINSVISVAGRTSSDGGFDQLQISADKLLIDTISAEPGKTERDWRQENYFLPTTISTLRWCYVKDDTTRLGLDTTWIDNLSFSTSNISYQSRICDVLDLTAQNCAMIQSITYNPPQSLWIITQATSVAGGSSLRSADIDDGQSTCVVLGLTLPINSVISVAGRSHSEGQADQLQISADNLRLDTLSAATGKTARDWRQENYFLPTTISTLSWCYVKDDTTSLGLDTTWIDNLSFSTSNIAYQSRICDVLDLTAQNCAMIQSVSYEPPELLWIITQATSVAGGSSLRSGDIDDGQSTCAVFGLTLPTNSRISVAGRTSSQGGFDPLQISADNLRLDTLSAESGKTARDWRQQNYFLPTTISTLRWCYVKDDTTSLGLDTTWIDNLSFSTSNISYQSRICAALDLTASDCSSIQSVSYEPPELLWIITPVTPFAGDSSLRSGDIGVSQQSCLVLELSLHADSQLSVAGRTSSRGGFDPLQIIADSLLIDTISAEPGQLERDWRQKSYLLPTAISTLSWCYAQNHFSPQGQNAAWIDNLSFSTLNISYQNRICDVLDLTASDCSLIQSVSYEPPQLLWIITQATSVAGGSSLRSAYIDAGQSSCLNLTLALPADVRIRFWWRLNFEANAGILSFAADSRRLGSFTPPPEQTSVNWQAETFNLTAAVTTLSWCYAINSSPGAGR